MSKARRGVAPHTQRLLVSKEPQEERQSSSRGWTKQQSWEDCSSGDTTSHTVTGAGWRGEAFPNLIPGGFGIMEANQLHAAQGVHSAGDDKRGTERA